MAEALLALGAMTTMTVAEEKDRPLPRYTRVRTVGMVSR